MFVLPRIEENNKDMHWMLDNIQLSPTLQMLDSTFVPHTSLHARVHLTGKDLVWMCLLKTGVLATGDTGLLDLTTLLDVLVEFEGKGFDTVRLVMQRMWSDVYSTATSSTPMETGQKVLQSLSESMPAMSEYIPQDETLDELKVLVSQFQNLTSRLGKDIQAESTSESIQRASQDAQKTIEEAKQQVNELIDRLSHKASQKAKTVVQKQAESLTATTSSTAGALLSTQEQVQHQIQQVKEKAGEGIQRAGHAVGESILETSHEALQESREHVEDIGEEMASEKAKAQPAKPKDVSHPESIPLPPESSTESSIEPSIETPTESSTESSIETPTGTAIETPSEMKTPPSTPTSEGLKERMGYFTQKAKEFLPTSSTPQSMKETIHESKHVSSPVAKPISQGQLPSVSDIKEVASNITSSIPSPSQLTSEAKEKTVSFLEQKAESLPFKAITTVRILNLGLDLKSEKKVFYDALKGVIENRIKVLVEERVNQEVNDALSHVGRTGMAQ